MIFDRNYSELSELGVSVVNTLSRETPKSLKRILAEFTGMKQGIIKRWTWTCELLYERERSVLR